MSRESFEFEKFIGNLFPKRNRGILDRREKSKARPE